MVLDFIREQNGQAIQSNPVNNTLSWFLVLFLCPVSCPGFPYEGTITYKPNKLFTPQLALVMGFLTIERKLWQSFGENIRIDHVVWGHITWIFKLVYLQKECQDINALTSLSIMILLIIIRFQNQSWCLTVGGLRKKRWCLYTMAFHAAMKTEIMSLDEKLYYLTKNKLDS